VSDAAKNLRELVRVAANAFADDTDVAYHLGRLVDAILEAAVERAREPKPLGDPTAGEDVVPPKPAAPSKAREWRERVIQRVAELPDRASPDDWPEAMLVTADELREILEGEEGELAEAEADRDAAIRESGELRVTIQESGARIMELERERDEARAQLRDAEAAKHEHAAAVLEEYSDSPHLATLYINRERNAARAARKNQ